jgi:hypothetical protein
MVVSISEAMTLHLGLNLVGYNSNEKNETKVTLFKSFYGSEPKIVSMMFHDMQTTTISEA